MGQGQLTTADVPRLIGELLGAIQSETRKPISPAVLRISTRLETAALASPKIEVAEQSQWFRFKLAPKEAELCTFLWTHCGKAVRREAILDALYPGEDQPLAKILDVMILKLNRKLKGWYRIENEYAFGFRIVWTRKWGNPRDVVEWRGIFMGRKAALIAEALFSAHGRWLHQRDLALACGSRVNSIGRIMKGLQKNLLGTPYLIENVRCAGHRMVVRVQCGQ